MNYEETLAYLYNQLPMYQRVGSVAFKKDLTNTLALCAYLGNPEKKFATVHVAGTNGKGSSAHTIAAILQVAGYKVGLYTSPHLKNFTERIRINGAEIPKQEVVDFVHQHRAMLESVQPSFFEMTVALAFSYFAHQKVDIAVIEVGLGGRLDSTNVIVPEVSLITNISFDHTDLLGDTLPAIAFEKAGIIKENVPVVVSERQAEVVSVFEEQARLRHAPLVFAADHYQASRSQQRLGEMTIEVLKDGKPVYTNLQLSSGGIYQLKNIPGILQCADVLAEKGWKIASSHIRQGITQMVALTGLKGRWQILSQQPLVVCDTAHNVAGMQLVLQQLLALPCDQLHMVMGVVREKEVNKILEMLPKDALYYFCQANIPRALEAEQLAARAAGFHLNYQIVPDVNEAVQTAISKANKNDVVFVGGSSFVVAEIEGL